MARRRSLRNLSLPGIIDPSEYDWQEEFLELAEDYSLNTSFQPQLLDAGKVLGLARAYARVLASRTRPLRPIRTKGGTSVDADTKLGGTSGKGTL